MEFSNPRRLASELDTRFDNKTKSSGLKLCKL